jgi:ribosomal protein S18 acetylase RimI-like enzyme
MAAQPDAMLPEGVGSAKPAVDVSSWLWPEEEVQINRVEILQQPRLGQVMDIEEQCFPPCERLGPHLMQEQARLRTSGLLLAEFGATVSGYLLFSRFGASGLVTKLAVAAPFRRRGIASALLRRGIQELEKPTRKSYLHDIQLHVDPARPEARALYEAHGFTKQALLPAYYGDARDALLMRRIVQPTGAVKVMGGSSGSI